MNNYDIEYSRDYHEFTKHSEISVQLRQDYLDWENKPRPFKFYTSLRPLLLSVDFSKPSMGALTAISRIEPRRQISADIMDMETIAEILFFCAGITRQVDYDSGTLYMRAASATGALYPIELYVVCEDIPGLKAGVYHFNPGDFSLTNLREGDYRSELAIATGDDKNVMDSPATIVFSSIAWKNAWKYRDRSYRHWFWDSGVIAANLLATTISVGLYTKLFLGFVDEKINRLLCFNNKQEASIALASIGLGLSKSSSRIKEITIVNHEVFPVSRKVEVEYPSIWKIHKASSLSTIEEAKTWTKTEIDFDQEADPEVSILNRRALMSNYNHGQPSLSEVILLRGSSRRFSRKPISFVQLCNVLYSSTRGIPLDFTKGGKVSTIDTYFIANDVEELQRGSYYFNKFTNSLELLKKDISRNISGYLCLGQSLFSDAAAVFFLMTDLNKFLRAYGNRGYRAVQFEAGIITGKIYLAAYAQGIGASGSTFFDDAVMEFFSPHASGKSTMIAIGVGVPGYKSKIGKILVGKMTREQILEKEYDSLKTIRL